MHRVGEVCPEWLLLEARECRLQARQLLSWQGWKARRPVAKFNETARRLTRETRR